MRAESTQWNGASLRSFNLAKAGHRITEPVPQSLRVCSSQWNLRLDCL